MSISILSLKSEESRCIKNGNYKLYFENDNLCISDGIKTLSINLNNYEIYDPTTSTALLPYNYNGDVGYRILTVSDCIMELLTQIIDLYNIYYKYEKFLDVTGETLTIKNNIVIHDNNIVDVLGGVGEIDVKLLSLEYLNEHKDELKGEKGDKGDKGEKGDSGTSAFDLWQEEVYGDILPISRSHEKGWQYIDPSGFGDKSNIALITYTKDYENRLNLFAKRTGKNALLLEEEADNILKEINYGTPKEEIDAINNRIQELEDSITPDMTDEEREEIENEIETLRDKIDYGMTPEEIEEIYKRYSAKKSEWINWQRDAKDDDNKEKLYTFSLIYKEVSGYPGDNPTEWEFRYYMYNLYLTGDLSLGAAIQIAEDKVNNQQTVMESIGKTAETGKKLGIAGTVLGAIGTIFGIGSTVGTVISYNSLQAQIAALAAERTAAGAVGSAIDISSLSNTVSD